MTQQPLLSLRSRGMILLSVLILVPIVIGPVFQRSVFRRLEEAVSDLGGGPNTGEVTQMIRSRHAEWRSTAFQSELALVLD